MSKNKISPETQENLRLLEAVLFASGEPVSLDMLQNQVGKDVEVMALLDLLKEQYTERGVNLVTIDGTWSFRSAPDLADRLKITKHPRRKLPRAAAEVLAIIAYHQPVTRPEIESIRGVETSRGTIDLLLELGWIRPGRRRDSPGQPLTWKTTPEFLSHFNLASLDELPGMEELKAAGLLDARPVLETLPRENEDKETLAASDDDFSGWIKDEPEEAAL